MFSAKTMAEEVTTWYFFSLSPLEPACIESEGA